jgi:hypothetical protein
MLYFWYYFRGTFQFYFISGEYYIIITNSLSITYDDNNWSYVQRLLTKSTLMELKIERLNVLVMFTCFIEKNNLWKRKRNVTAIVLLYYPEFFAKIKKKKKKKKHALLCDKNKNSKHILRHCAFDTSPGLSRQLVHQIELYRHMQYVVTVTHFGNRCQSECYKDLPSLSMTHN